MVMQDKSDKIKEEGRERRKGCEGGRKKRANVGKAGPLNGSKGKEREMGWWQMERCTHYLNSNLKIYYGTEPCILAALTRSGD